MIRGIIWKATQHSEVAEALFDQLVDNYQRKGHTIKVFKSDVSMRFTADNGDFWEVVSARGSMKAKRCNISYIERGVPTWFIREIIFKCTTELPFRSISYFGDYGIEGDDNYV